MTRVRRISTDGPFYEQAAALRTRVLLEPIGWTMEDYLDESPGREERCEHYVAVIDHPGGERVVGVALLLGAEGCADGLGGPRPAGCEPQHPEPGWGWGKVLQVATEPQLQHQGIGRRVMMAVEARAFGELGLDALYCHAQLSACPFYERLGWTIESGRFLEAEIEHHRMERRVH